MKQYLNLLKDILDNGEQRQDRTGTGTLSVFCREMRFDLNKGFPVLTTKKVNYRAAFIETLWFLSGSTNIKPLNEQGVHIWDQWADKNGELGSIYGAQWRSFSDGFCDFIDQIANLVEGLKNNPQSRRHLVTAWNPGDLDNCALPPCHYAFQCYVSSDNKLSLKFNMRSSDAFIGLPFNLINYALLCHLLAEQCGLGVGELIWSGADCHIYSNHIEQVKLQLSREPLDNNAVLVLKSGVNSIFDYTIDDITLDGFRSHPAIKGDVAV